jgi:hypothetical protein
MKWLKHMTATWDDERVARLVEGGGMEALARYGAYWRLCEIVAGQMDGNTTQTSVQFPLSRWSTLLQLRTNTRSIVQKIADCGLIEVELLGNDIRVSIPNLLKLRDEYSRKSGVTPDKLPPRTEQKRSPDFVRKEEEEEKTRTRGTRDAEKQPPPYSGENNFQNGDGSDLSAIIRKIIMAHPKSVVRKLRPSEVRPSDLALVFEAVQAEAEIAGSSRQVAAEKLLARMEEEFASRDDLSFLPDVKNFFSNRDYRRDPDSFMTQRPKQAQRETERDRIFREAIERSKARQSSEADGDERDEDLCIVAKESAGGGVN